MNKQELINQLQIHHQQFADYIETLSTSDFIKSLPGKWTPGQQTDHIVKSVSPVAMAFGLPKIAPKLLFGKSTRKSKSYDELIDKYKLKLLQGGKASGKFVPKEIPTGEKFILPKAVIHYINTLCKHVEKTSEDDLDTYVLPHPLLGKLTFREMVYFTIYHVQHHHEITKRDLTM